MEETPPSLSLLIWFDPLRVNVHNRKAAVDVRASKKVPYLIDVKAEVVELADTPS
jgi:hypothetical protein